MTASFHLQRRINTLNVLLPTRPHSILSSPPHQLIAFKSIRVGAKVSTNKKYQNEHLGANGAQHHLGTEDFPSTAEISTESGKCGSLKFRVVKLLTPLK